jgi:hypothetical protein
LKGGDAVKKSLAGFIFISVLFSAACAQVAEETSSSPDDKPYPATLEPRSGPEIMGRLWVSPNPIAFEPGNPQEMVTVSLLAGERIVVEDITIEGSSEYVLKLAKEPGGFPYEEAPCCIDGPCAGGGLLAFPVRYTPSGTAPGPVNLIIHTADPTSPSFMVPIIVDYEGKYPKAGADDPRGWEPDFVWVNPNPVRFAAIPPGESTTVTLCLGGFGRPETGFGITDISVAGEGLSIAGMRTYEGTDAVDPSGHFILFPDYLDLTYTSVNGESVDGLLRISFLDRWESELTLAVPILVR